MAAHDENGRIPRNDRQAAAGRDLSSGLEFYSFRHPAGHRVAPERNQKLTCHGYDRDAPCATGKAADALTKPDAQGTSRLIAQPQPSELNEG